MSKVNVFNYAWIDLVFEGRNQEYGAYQLRRQDSKTTMLALFSGIGLMVALVSIPTVINYFSPVEEVAAVTPDNGGLIIKVDDFKPPVLEKQKPEPLVEKPAPAAAAPPSATPTIQHTAFVATSDPVPDLPTMTEVLASNPGTTTTEGTPGGSIINGVPGGTPGGTGTAVTTNTGSGDAIENFVDVMPEYPGGIKEFYKEVGNRFRTPDTDSDTALKVYVSFVVEKDGSMTNIKVLRDPCNCMGKEAIRVLNTIKTRWAAGKKKGVAVRTAYNLPITVNLK
ncbi:energy transducer TonB [Flavobacterium subsaxonicum]|uniref:TonB C-terminal domain-containing protein n=1 Tax=Flavobacterium subsaxonicum WB 4.1-42 = DSM 21790 TaxID=1121898 RepID=A0A0A2MMB1_9FLAO|nr:energy transducer TonB [Flavobacterium subsaxonicum]KGO93464.1 hypothetical protein Q766_09235 [Flavobacterium subsaxonicum WB 4.1-42 = DSM 21790]